MQFSEMHGVGRVNTQTQTKNIELTRTFVINIRGLKLLFYLTKRNSE